MGSNKRHYDITMSRRTRKPLKVRDDSGDDHSLKDSPPKGAGDEGEENDRKSLKQLIDGDGNAKAVPSDEVGKGVIRSSLGEHLSDGENKQLQLVGVQQNKGLHGLKLKKMVSRYAKILGHLMKKNRDSSLRESKKKQILMLTS